MNDIAGKRHKKMDICDDIINKVDKYHQYFNMVYFNIRW